MSRRGQCWDNAVDESFWSILKRECLPLNTKYKSRKEGISKICNWISYYNGFRLNYGSVSGIFYPFILKYRMMEKIWQRKSAIQKNLLRRNRCLISP